MKEHADMRSSSAARSSRRRYRPASPWPAGLGKRGIVPGIPYRKHSKNPVLYDKTLYRQRHRIESSFARIKDGRRAAMRYDRCAHTFLFCLLRYLNHFFVR